MAPQLFLGFLEQNDCRFFRIQDNSAYGEGFTPECGALYVTPPGFNYPTGFEVDPYFNILINSSNLGLTKPSEPLAELSDGAYIVRYSINPNDKTWVEYYHFVNCVQLSKYNAVLCKLNLMGCDSDDTKESYMKELCKIKLYIDGAKAYAERGALDKSGELYSYADKLLTKLSDKISGCKTC
jgi:hypothetical protein